MRLVLLVENLSFALQSDGFFPSYPLFCVEFIVLIGFGWVHWCAASSSGSFLSVGSSLPRLLAFFVSHCVLDEATVLSRVESVKAGIEGLSGCGSFFWLKIFHLHCNLMGSSRVIPSFAPNSLC
jgi:hypothetical protein